MTFFVDAEIIRSIKVVTIPNSYFIGELAYLPSGIPFLPVTAQPVVVSDMHSINKTRKRRRGKPTEGIE
jgi:hypothetical protein